MTNDMTQTPDAPKPEPKLWLFALVATLLACLAVAVTYWHYSQQQPVPVAQPVETPKPVETPPPAAELSIADAEAKARALLEGLSPELAKLLPTDLLRRTVAAVQLASEGESWFHLFSSLRPSGEFEVMERKKQTFIAPGAHARYDALVTLISAVDSAKLAEAYVAVRPALVQLFGEVARPGAQFDEALKLALKPVLEADLPEGDLELVPKGAIWAFKDEKLEARNPTAKLMLRLGRNNARKLQRSAQAFVDAAKL